MMAVSSTQKEFFMDPFWVVLAFYIVGLADLPYGFYMITRLVTFLVAVWLLWQLHAVRSRATPLIWLVASVAILYNPIAPIYLYSKTIWRCVSAAGNARRFAPRPSLRSGPPSLRDDVLRSPAARWSNPDAGSHPHHLQTKQKGCPCRDTLFTLIGGGWLTAEMLPRSAISDQCERVRNVAKSGS